jgi:hypothetical protein
MKIIKNVKFMGVDTSGKKGENKAKIFKGFEL